MSSPSPPANASLPTDETGLTADELFDVVTARRRRRVLRTLRRRGGTMTFDSLTSVLERGESDRWERASTTLHHLVLPKLEHADLLVRDDDDIVLTDGGTSVAAWLAVVTTR